MDEKHPVGRLRRLGTAALGAGAFLLRHPSLWAWPAALALTLLAPSGMERSYRALASYYLPALELVLLGCLPSFFWWTRRGGAPGPPLLPRRVLIGLTLAVLTAATIVRVWDLGEWPPNGIGFEETQLAARANLGPNWPRNFIVMYSPPSEHALTAYATSLAFTFFGTGFLQMRLAYIIGGILCPFLLYAVCRKLVVWEVALFAVALFSVSWWQIAASRVADEIFFPLWAELAVLWLLLDFEETGRSWVAFLLALLSGLLIYEYTAYHLVVPVLAGYLLARALLWGIRLLRDPAPAPERRRRVIAAVRTYAPGVIAMLLVWTIIAQLQLVHDVRLGAESWFLEGFRRHSSDANGLLAHLQASDDLPAFILHKLVIPVQAAYAPGYGDFCRYLAIGEHPAFDRATAIAMGVGLVLVAATIGRRFHALVLVWASLLFVAGALLPENPNLHRFYVALPFFYLFIALGAQVLWDWLRAPAARAVLLGICAAVVLYAGAVNLHHLFWVLMPNAELRDHWRWPRTEVINWIRAHGRDDWICVVADDERSIYGPNPMQPEWSWLVQDWNVLVSGSAAQCIRARRGEAGARYYILALADPPTDLPALLRAHYPDARELAPIKVPTHNFVARTFLVPAQPRVDRRPPRSDLPPTWNLYGHR